MPVGWDNQIGNRFAVFLDYTYQKDFSSKLFDSDDSLKKFMRPIAQVGFGVGNFTNFVNAGGMVVVGRSGNVFPSSSIKPTTGNSTSKRSDERPLYFYFGFETRYYLNNLLIEGSGDSAHNITLSNGVIDLISGISFPFTYPLKWLDIECNCNLNYQIIR